MSDKKPCRKALNFDLDTKLLKVYYPKKNFLGAYADIRKFLYAEGFTHRQWSGYVSDTILSDSAITAKITKMVSEFPWLKDCVRRFDVTDIGEQHDLTQLITGKEKTRLQERSQETVQKEVSMPKKRSLFSRAKLNETAQEIREQKRQPQKNKVHENER